MQVIRRNPGLLDWLVRPEVLYLDPEAEVLHLSPGMDALREQLRAQVERYGDTPELVGALNAEKNRELLRFGTRNLVGLTDTFETFEALTMLADVIVQAVYEVVYARLVEKRGVPRNRSGEEVGFVVLGLGKMGGSELSFGSDLDIVFVYGEDGETDGARPQGEFAIFHRSGAADDRDAGTEYATGEALSSGCAVAPRGVECAFGAVFGVL